MSNHPYASLPTPARGAEPITQFRDEHRFLSNFWYAPGIELAGVAGPTVEHVFQALKTHDPLERAAVLAATTPGRAKRIGRTVTLRPDWEDVKLGIMARLQGQKYTHNPELARQLLATGDAELVEGNHWCDTFYGRCTCTRHADEGQNWLGSILMILRSTLIGAGTH